MKLRSMNVHSTEGPRMIANWLIYASILLGVALLAQLYSIVPLWLFYSVVAGWIAYLVVGIAVTLRVNSPYPVSTHPIQCLSSSQL